MTAAAPAGSDHRLDDDAVRAGLAASPAWSIDAAAPVGTLVRTIRFAGWLETIAFVNALAWICHREDHHPDLAIGFDRATVRFSTHSAGGLTERDLRLARLVDGLLSGDSAAG